MFKLALDAGHWLGEPGKRCLRSIDPQETREWILNNRICDRIEEKLKAYDGIQVLRIDDTTGKNDVALEARAKKANDFGANFYLSVHHNAGIKGGNGGGISAYVYTKVDDNTRDWQKKLYDALIKKTGLKGNRANPLSSDTFTVLRKTRMAAVLLELGFMDSTVDTPIILTDDFANECVDAIVEVVVAKGGLKKKAVKVETPVVSKPEEPKAEVKTESPKETTENKTTEEDAASKVETETKHEAAEETTTETAEEPSDLPQKKSWVEVIKDILKLIIEWLHLINTDK